MAQTESADAGGDAELGLDNVGGVFVVLTSGMVIATLVAVCEFSWKARKLAHKGGNVTRAIRSELDAAFRFSSFLYSFLFFLGGPSDDIRFCCRSLSGNTKPARPTD